MSQINPKTRHASLRQFMSEDLTPYHEFSTGSLNFREFSEDTPELRYYTFDSQKLGSNDVKDLAMKTFEQNYDKGNLFGKRNDVTLFEGWKYNNKAIEKLRQLGFEKEKRLESLSLNAFYNPFSKFFWKRTHLPEIIASGCIVGGISGLVHQNSSSGWMLACGIGSGIGFEIIRRRSKNYEKEQLNSISKNISYYNNFRRNIENADVKIISPEEAFRIYNKAEKSNHVGDYAKLDVDKVNRDLSNVYDQY